MDVIFLVEMTNMCFSFRFVCEEPYSLECLPIRRVSLLNSFRVLGMLFTPVYNGLISWVLTRCYESLLAWIGVSSRLWFSFIIWQKHQWTVKKKEWDECVTKKYKMTPPLNWILLKFHNAGSWVQMLTPKVFTTPLPVSGQCSNKFFCIWYYLSIPTTSWYPDHWTCTH